MMNTTNKRSTCFDENVDASATPSQARQRTHLWSVVQTALPKRSPGRPYSAAQMAPMGIRESPAGKTSRSRFTRAQNIASAVCLTMFSHTAPAPSAPSASCHAGSSRSGRKGSDTRCVWRAHARLCVTACRCARMCACVHARMRVCNVRACTRMYAGRGSDTRCAWRVFSFHSNSRSTGESLGLIPPEDCMEPQCLACVCVHFMHVCMHVCPGSGFRGWSPHIAKGRRQTDWPYVFYVCATF